MKGISAILLCSFLALAAGNKCPSEQENDWYIELLLRHEDCEKFYKCTFGEPVVQVCPPGLFFNLELWQCDWEDNVDCADRNVPGEERPEPEPEVEEDAVTEPEEEILPEPEPEVEEEVVPEPEPEEEEPEVDEEVVPEPEPEIEEEVVPEPEPEVEEPEVEEEVVPEPEPEVEEPEVEDEAVTEPEPEVEEEVTPEPEPEVEEEVIPEPEEEKPEIEFQENGCPVNPHVHWLLPHETDCNLFYYCVWGQKVQRQCPSSLHFNRDIQVCDWPWDAGCPLSLNKHLESRRAILRGIQL